MPGRSPKFTLPRIVTALVEFGMPYADRERFLEILQRVKARTGRRPKFAPHDPEAAAERQRKLDEMNELAAQLDELHQSKT